MKTCSLFPLLRAWLAGLCLTVAMPLTVAALPYTTNLDGLISELQVRSAALAGSTNKAEIKLKSSVDKVLASFLAKDSTSLSMDIKLLGNAAKALAKLYPADFAPAPLTVQPNNVVQTYTNLDELIQLALDAFGGDIYALASAAQSLVNAAPASSCKDKAQAVLDDVAAQLALLPSAPDNATSVKILSTAAKNVLKGQSLAATVANCGSSGGGGGGGGGNWYDWKLSYTVNGTKISVYENGQTSSPDLVGISYFNTGTLQVLAYKQGGSPYLYFTSNIGNPGGGTHSIVSGTYSDGINSYTITNGSITITKWPKSFDQFDDLFGKGTFSFTATGTAGTISGTSGSFSTWIYPPF